MPSAGKKHMQPMASARKHVAMSATKYKQKLRENMKGETNNFCTDWLEFIKAVF